MGLTRYRHKRDFSRTSEPRGGDKKSKRAAKGPLYVIQKHAARNLHYDFRLQIGDVMKSWAVPKGPSLDPDVRRLAMHVEDHPLEYGSFEGTIPAGEYGGGTVMLWDTGTWEMAEDAEQAYRQGKLHFTLHGEKLRGEWVLVRKSGRGSSNGSEPGKDPWFLFKIRDAESSTTIDILESAPLSAKSGRDLEQIAENKRSVWRSRPAKQRAATHATELRKETASRQASRSSWKQMLAQLDGAKTAKMPTKVVPQLATLVKQPPAGNEWFSEIKFDGYRMLVRVDGQHVTFQSRNQLDWTNRFEHLVKAVRGLGLGSAIFDGEVVALETDGSSSFQALQNAFSEGRQQHLVYYIFDLLYLDGQSLTNVALEDRKQVLAKLLAGLKGPIRYSDHIEGHAAEFFEQICKRRLEGIVCKRRDRPYRAGRSAEWLKLKCSHREEFVIGGYTPPSGSRRGFGALLLGYHDRQGDLVYAGRVGTGFGDQLLVDLATRLKEIEQPASPFKNLQGRTGEARGVHWVKPKLVGQIAFSDWTHDDRLRHPAFQGLREDKPAREVVMERPVALKTVESEAEKLPAQKSGKLKTGKGKTGKRKADSGKTTAKAADPLTAAIPSSVRLTHPDKVLYPDTGITKAQLAGYYATIADWILPHLVDRPLVLVRCPDGVNKACFYQKDSARGMPEAIKHVAIPDKTKKINYAVIHDLEGLLSLVQMSTLEIHVWGSHAKTPEKPDRLVFDLDPDPSVPWKRVVESAFQLRDFLEALDLTSFLKTTGGKGLHLVLPVARRLDWDDTKTICHAIATAIAEADPDRYTVNMSKAARGGKIYLDYLRNSRGATSVAAYSTRARAGAPVSMPISWDELRSTKSADQFTLENVPARLAGLKSDPWHEIEHTKQALSKSMLKKLSV